MVLPGSAMQKKSINCSSKVVRFKRGSAKDIFLCFIGTACLMVFFALLEADKWNRGHPTIGSSIAFLLGAGAVFSAMWSWYGFQSVEIDAENKTIRFSNLDSYHRWRTFSSIDVMSIHVLSSGAHIRFALAPSSSRSWNNARLMNASGGSSYDSELFLTLVQQVIAVYPDMKVQGLYPSYRGRLPM